MKLSNIQKKVCMWGSGTLSGLGIAFLIVISAAMKHTGYIVENYDYAILLITFLFSTIFGVLGLWKIQLKHIRKGDKA